METWLLASVRIIGSAVGTMTAAECAGSHSHRHPCCFRSKQKIMLLGLPSAASGSSWSENSKRHILSLFSVTARQLQTWLPETHCNRCGQGTRLEKSPRSSSLTYDPRMSF